jgi:transposase
LDRTLPRRTTAICVDEGGRRLWRGECHTQPDEIAALVCRHAGADVRIGIETGSMTPWLVHELRGRSLAVTYLDARHARVIKSSRSDS